MVKLWKKKPFQLWPYYLKHWKVKYIIRTNSQAQPRVRYLKSGTRCNKTKPKKVKYMIGENSRAESRT